MPPIAFSASASGPMGMPDVELFHSTILSLYRDQILPCTTDIIRRLKERGADEVASKFASIARENPDRFIVSHNATDKRRKPQTTTQTAEASEENVFVLLRSPPSAFTGFIDPKDGEDLYAFDVWRNFTSYLCQLMQNKNADILREDCTLKHFQFKGGRYGLAFELKDAAGGTGSAGSPSASLHPLTLAALGHLQHKELSFQQTAGGEVTCSYTDKLASLQGASLGRICHLVQLAISNGVLAYENNVLQPVAACRSKVSAAFACGVGSTVSTFPLGGGRGAGVDGAGRGKDVNGPNGGSGQGQCSSVGEVSACLQLLFKDHPEGLLLSQLKKKIVSRTGLTVNPGVFGYAKLSNLLAAQAFEGVCQLFVDRNNHLMILPANRPLPPNTERVTHSEVFLPLQETVRVSRIFNSSDHGNLSFSFWKAEAQKAQKQNNFTSLYSYQQTAQHAYDPHSTPEVQQAAHLALSLAGVAAAQEAELHSGRFTSAAVRTRKAAMLDGERADWVSRAFASVPAGRVPAPIAAIWEQSPSENAPLVSSNTGAALVDPVQPEEAEKRVGALLPWRTPGVGLTDEALRQNDKIALALLSGGSIISDLSSSDAETGSTDASVANRSTSSSLLQPPQPAASMGGLKKISVPVPRSPGSASVFASTTAGSGTSQTPSVASDEHVSGDLASLPPSPPNMQQTPHCKGGPVQFMWEGGRQSGQSTLAPPPPEGGGGAPKSPPASPLIPPPGFEMRVNSRRVSGAPIYPGLWMQ